MRARGPGRAAAIRSLHQKAQVLSTDWASLPVSPTHVPRARPAASLITDECANQFKKKSAVVAALENILFLKTDPRGFLAM